jgi:nucleotide-binding universal stress UspA family protein
MKEVRKILFPIDFASNYQPLLPWVSTFATKFGATVYVLFVTQDLSSYSTFYVPHGNIQSFQEEAMAAAKKKMDAVVKESFQGFAKLETRVELGSPADKVLAFANQEKIDLIVMGAHGRKGLERAIFGSVADKVLRGAPCPVVAINPDKA